MAIISEHSRETAASQRWPLFSATHTHIRVEERPSANPSQSSPYARPKPSHSVLSSAWYMKENYGRKSKKKMMWCHLAGVARVDQGLHIAVPGHPCSHPVSSVRGWVCGAHPPRCQKICALVRICANLRDCAIFSVCATIVNGWRRTQSTQIKVYVNLR